jgi:hypothetical protein
MTDFRVNHNPFGVLYNPVSVQTDLEILTDRRLFTESDLYRFNNRWISFNHYTLFADNDKTKCLQKINDSIISASELLEEAGFLFITFGTSWVYEFLKTGQVVANCHKIPAQEFRRFLLSTEDIVGSWDVLSVTGRMVPQATRSANRYFLLPFISWSAGIRMQAIFLPMKYLWMNCEITGFMTKT